MAIKATTSAFNSSLLALMLITAGGVSAQVPVDDNGNPVGKPIETIGASNSATAGDLDAPYDNVDDSMYADDAVDEVPTIDSSESRFTDAELQALVGPIALYPDDLLAIVLPASTYPLQIVQAARFLDDYEKDKSLTPDEEWDESVVALLNYPETLRMLDDDIDWTWQLGDAVINQQSAVIGAVESFRDRAYAAGNLKSDDHQNVTEEDGIIEIIPIEDDVIYVPYYEPSYVVERQTVPVYHYYATPRPVYYYPYPSSYLFASDYFWGVSMSYGIVWSSNYLHVYHPSYWGHPYYGYNYYGHYYRSPSISVYNSYYVNSRNVYSSTRYRDGDHWQPHRRAGARQSDYRAIRSTERAHTRDYRDSVSYGGNTGTGQTHSINRRRDEQAGTVTGNSRSLQRDVARDNNAATLQQGATRVRTGDSASTADRSNTTRRQANADAANRTTDNVRFRERPVRDLADRTARAGQNPQPQRTAAGERNAGRNTDQLRTQLVDSNQANGNINRSNTARTTAARSDTSRPIANRSAPNRSAANGTNANRSTAGRPSTQAAAARSTQRTAAASAGRPQRQAEPVQRAERRAAPTPERQVRQQARPTQQSPRADAPARAQQPARAERGSSNDSQANSRTSSDRHANRNPRNKD